jgi:hypothetical protein
MNHLILCDVGDDHHCRRHQQNGYALATLAVAHSAVGQGRANLVACQPNLGEGDHLVVEHLEEEVLAILEGNDQAGRAAGILDRLFRVLPEGIAHASHTIRMGAVLARVDVGAAHPLDPAKVAAALVPAAAAAAAALAVGTGQRWLQLNHENEFPLHQAFPVQHRVPCDVFPWLPSIALLPCHGRPQERYREHLGVLHTAGHRRW